MVGLTAYAMRYRYANTALAIVLLAGLVGFTLWMYFIGLPGRVPRSAVMWIVLLVALLVRPPVPLSAR